MAESETSINKDFDIKLFSTVFKRWWYVVVFALTATFIGAFLFLRYTKPVYESNMILQIAAEDQGADVLDIKGVNKQSNINAEIELLRSEFTLSNALKSLDLNITYYAEGDFLTEEKYGSYSFLIKPIELKDSSLCNTRINLELLEDERIKLYYVFKGKEYSFITNPGEKIETPHFEVILVVEAWSSFKADIDKNNLYFKFNNLDDLTRSYIRNLTVSAIDQNARTIEIAFRSNNARLSMDIVQAVGQTFFKHHEKIKKQSADNILEFINIQLDSLSRELTRSKDSIMFYKRSQSLADPDNKSASLSQRMEKIQDDLISYKEEKFILQEIKKKIADSPDQMEVYKMIPVIIGRSFEGALLDRVNQLHDLIEDKENLLLNLTPDNQSIKIIENRIDITVDEISRTINFLLERVEQRVKRIESFRRQLENEYFNLPEQKMELSRLSNMQQLNEKYFNLFTEKQVQYSISNAGYTSQNKILKKPAVNNSAVSPKRNMIYGASIFLGLVIGFGFIFIKYLLFNEINNLDDFEKIVPENVSLLGSIPFYRKKMTHSKLLVSEAPKSMMAESLRSIRTNISFINKNAKVIAFTSSISGEGKTFMALNLGGVFALSGKKTIIIDLDLRKPKVNLGLDLDNELGMSNVLSGQINYKDVIKNTDIKNFHVITSGVNPPNPSELILSKKFDEVLTQLKEDYDIVIIDTPPVGLVSDGFNVLTNADIPIYVFKSNYSKRSFVKNVINISTKRGIKNLSVVLNGVKVSKSNYGYGYNSYYQDDFTPKRWWQFWKKK